MAKKKAKKKVVKKKVAKTATKVAKKVAKKKAVASVSKRQVNVMLDEKTINKLDKLTKKLELSRSDLITKLIKSG